MHSWSSFLFFGRTTRLMVHGPRIESRPTAVKTPSPNHWTTREFPLGSLYYNSMQPSLTLTNTEMIISVMMNFSSGKTHVTVFSLEIYFHIENGKNQQCYHLKPSNHSLQRSCLHFYMHFSHLFMPQSIHGTPRLIYTPVRKFIVL